jgi:hypothetical protein
MIEIKLSQGAKPGHGGVLPGAKVTPGNRRGARRPGRRPTAFRRLNHSAFTTPIEFLEFIARLRELSGGKPVGFKLAIGHPWEWFAIVKAMLQTGIAPDFIVVDGGEGGTGAAPLEFTDHVGAPLARRPDAGAQHPGRRQSAPAGQHRRLGQDRHRLRHGTHHRHRRRLVQLGPRLHVRAGLPASPDLPHRPLPDRCHHPGSRRACVPSTSATNPRACTSSIATP